LGAKACPEGGVDGFGCEVETKREGVSIWEKDFAMILLVKVLVERAEDVLAAQGAN